MTERPAISVSPPDAWERRRRLFGAIGSALDLDVVPTSDARTASARAAIVFGPRTTDRHSLPTLEVPAGDGDMTTRDAEVRFAATEPLDRSLHDATLTHRELTSVALVPDARERIFAHASGTPVWIGGPHGERVAVGIPELAPGEALRDRLCAGRFLPLVPIVDFLRRAVPETLSPRCSHATFLFDDPNLHTTSYGYLDYAALVADARDAGYHVAFALIPLDTWHSSRAATALFRASADVLSLVVHGNDHVRRELAQPLDPQARRSLLAQSLWRIERFERRSGVSVARIMVPPHGACSREMAADMPSMGFEALCVSRPYPWLDAPPVDRPLAGWHPTEIVDGGLSVVPRLHLNADRDEIVLRAFLRQPIILYGHHRDVRGGLNVLRRAAEDVNRVGDVRWASPGEIAASLFQSHRDGPRLRVRLHTRRVAVVVPEGVRKLVVDWPISNSSERILVNGAPPDELTLPAGRPSTVEVRVTTEDAAAERDPIRSPHRPAVWPYTRRTLAEIRDRTLPLVRRGG